LVNLALWEIRNYLKAVCSLLQRLKPHLGELRTGYDGCKSGFCEGAGVSAAAYVCNELLLHW
jgi:hypothetical protein